MEKRSNRKWLTGQSGLCGDGTTSVKLGNERVKRCNYTEKTGALGHIATYQIRIDTGDDSISERAEATYSLPLVGGLTLGGYRVSKVANVRFVPFLAPWQI